jgi:hypothetical protein
MEWYQPPILSRQEKSSRKGQPPAIFLEESKRASFAGPHVGFAAHRSLALVRMARLHSPFS